MLSDCKKCLIILIGPSVQNTFLLKYERLPTCQVHLEFHIQLLGKS